MLEGRERRGWRGEEEGLDGRERRDGEGRERGRKRRRGKAKGCDDVSCTDITHTNCAPIFN